MASPTAIVGSRMSHLRWRTMAKYSPIFRGRNSTLIELLLDCHKTLPQRHRDAEKNEKSFEKLCLIVYCFSFLCVSVSLRQISYKVARVLRASLASGKFVFSLKRKAVSISLRAPALSPLAASATPRWK